jgi:putative DNA primase/helicase
VSAIGQYTHSLTSKDRHIIARDIAASFREAMLADGIVPPPLIIADGTFRRYSTNGKHGDRAGFYVLHGDGVPSGYYGD